MDYKIRIVLTILEAGSGFLTIRASYLGPQYHIYLFKPLTVIFIILMAVRLVKTNASFYGYSIIAGLVCSLAGDIFLMLPSDQFLAGLISFLVGHIFYIMAFTSAKRIRINWAVLPFILYGALIFAILLPSFGKLRLPVLIYIIVILTMGWQAWDRWTKRRQVFAFLALIGAVLFIFSDTILAFNMFFEPFGPARALTFGLYFPAQWFLAQSIQQSRAPE